MRARGGSSGALEDVDIAGIDRMLGASGGDEVAEGSVRYFTGTPRHLGLDNGLFLKHCERQHESVGQFVHSTCNVRFQKYTCDIYTSTFTVTCSAQYVADLRSLQLEPEPTRPICDTYSISHEIALFHS